MIILIDGYNLMPNLKLRGDTFEAKRENMIAQLIDFVRVNPAKIILVFDGQHNPSMHRGNETHGPIQVIFSAQGETADDVIEDLIMKRKGKARDYMMVSSDRRLINFAAENAVKTMTSQQFAELFE